MILFTIISVCILLYTIFADGWLICSIKQNIKEGYKVFRKILGDIGVWFFANVLFNALNFFACFGISIVMLFVLCNTRPVETSQWQFNINALQDNIGVEGRFRYGGRGYINDELSYYYSRTMSKGEIIEHIPANKTYIRYSDTEKPHVEVHQKRINIPEWMYKVFLCLESMNDKTTDYYVIVAPEGTITNTGQYEIDMKQVIKNELSF